MTTPPDPTTMPGALLLQEHAELHQIIGGDRALRAGTQATVSRRAEAIANELDRRLAW